MSCLLLLGKKKIRRVTYKDSYKGYIISFKTICIGYWSFVTRMKKKRWVTYKVLKVILYPLKLSLKVTWRFLFVRVYFHFTRFGFVII